MSIITRVSPDFIRFSATEATVDVLQAVQALNPKYIVVYQVDLNGVCSNHVFDYDDFIRRLQLRLSTNNVPLRESLQLEHRLQATAVAPEDVPLAKNGDVVIEGDTITGVVGPQIAIADSLRGVGQADAESASIERRESALIEAEFPDEITLGSTASLVVTCFSPDWFAMKETLTSLSLDPTEMLVVIVRAEKLALLDQRECKLSIPAPRHCTSCRFELEAQSFGIGRIEVRLYQGVSQVGEIILKPKIMSEKFERVGVITRSRQLEGVHSDPIPDLEIRIFDRTINGKGAIEFELTARPSGPLDFYHTPFPMVILESRTKEYHKRLFEVIEDAPLFDNDDIEAIDLELRSIGLKLFNTLFPKELKETFWQYGSKIQSIQVLSREPYIPWEMVLVPKGDTLPEDKFLCEQFVLTRWLDGQRSPHKIRLNRLRYVIPIYKNPKLVLPMTNKERDILEGFADEYDLDVEPISANRLAVLKALRSGSFDALHFSCHGSFDTENADTSILLLESKFVDNATNEKSEILQKLHSVNATALAGNPHRRAPLIFLNACQTGRSAFSLTGIGGWAAEFIRAGAGVFVGSHWSIGDYAAVVFAQAFYTNLLAGQTVGASARAARLEVKEKTGNPTWLAYTVFAHPLAKVVRD